MSSIRPVVLCGGTGTRLWPLSRRLEPKQFQKLVGENSLFHETLERFFGNGFGAAAILANAGQEARVRMELSSMTHPHGTPTVIVEPAMRSTAPAIAAAAAILAGEDPDAIMLVVPSDHKIGRPDRLLAAVQKAKHFVEEGGIALFGITPTAPETGFGYIRAGVAGDTAILPVEAFVEKPDIERARQLVADGRHSWNSGIFMFRAITVLEELERFAPAVLSAAAAAVAGARHAEGAIRLAPSFAEAPEISIDHAVMEHSHRLGVIPIAPEWNDLGSFEALWEVGERDGDENVVLGEAVLRDVKRSYVRGGRRLVSVVGLSNIVVVDTDDAVLVVSRAQSQDVKFIAQQLAGSGHPAADRHLADHRPGARRMLLDADQHCRTERLDIQPGGHFELDAGEETQTRSLLAVTPGISVTSAGRNRVLNTGEALRLEGNIAVRLHNDGERAAIVTLTSFAVPDFTLSAATRKAS